VPNYTALQRRIINEQLRAHDAREALGWDLADGERWMAPDPLNPGKWITEAEWLERTGLPDPEFMDEEDHVVLKCLQLMGEAHGSRRDGVLAIYEYLRPAVPPKAAA
jgi:hypothetical protein